MIEKSEVIDSRDVISELESMEADREALVYAVEEAEEALVEARDAGEDTQAEEEALEDARLALEGWDDENGEDLEALRKLNEDGEGATREWIHGETLIREDYFPEYAEELCKDIGDIPRELPWYIANHIDWEGVAGELKADYTEIDFYGDTYLIRA